MNKILTASFLFFICQGPCLMAQDSNESKRIYDSWVIFNQVLPIERGHIVELKDSSIVMFNKDLSINENPISYSINNIEMIQVRSKGRVGRSILLGSVIGMAVGALVANVTFSKEKYSWEAADRGERIMQGMTIGLGAGVLVGGIIGGLKVKIPINRSQTNYEKQKQRLENYVKEN